MKWGVVVIKLALPIFEGDQMYIYTGSAGFLFPAVYPVEFVRSAAAPSETSQRGLKILPQVLCTSLELSNQ